MTTLAVTPKQNRSRWPRLTIDGSLPLGAALAAMLITAGVNPLKYNDPTGVNQ